MNPYEPHVNAENFDLGLYLAGFDSRLLSTTEGRRLLTRLDPLLFAVIYMRHHLVSPETGGITFADFHLDIFRQARGWIRKPETAAQYRDAFIAPRNCGKSTLLFGLVPMWAAAHKHVTFIAAFSHTGGQAEQHLQSYRIELETNELLRIDYPELCTPLVRSESKTKVTYRRDQIQQANGFVFVAKGIDTGVLGMKIGNRRPDLILCDDIEPPEDSYSAYQCRQRLGTLIDAVLPLNVFARVVIVGTTVMSGSIIHELVKAARGAETGDWIEEENFKAHYYPAIVVRDDGSERSCWPAKWTYEFLTGIRRTRQYAKNYANEPVSADGAYWTREDFKYGDPGTCTQFIVEVDPAVTTRTKSDYTGIAVIGYSPVDDVCVVFEAIQVKMTGREIRGYLLMLIDRYPRVKAVRIESNQGGGVWAEILAPLPVKLLDVHNSVAKEVRAGRNLDYWQSGHVLHAKELPAFEEQACAFPNVTNDDLVDCVGDGVDFMMTINRRKVRPKRKARSYL